MASARGARVEVSLPERGRSAPARPAGVLLVDEGGCTEELLVPAQVGRRLVSLFGGNSSACSVERARELVSRATRDCARERVEALVGRRDYCARELARKLLEAGYPRDVVEERVGRAVASGVVDDARYARTFARSKVAAGWGRSRIERELERRGVAREVAVEATREEAGEEGERERALALASRRSLTGRNDVQRIARFLCGRGFSPGLAFDVAREVVGSGEGGSPVAGHLT